MCSLKKHITQTKCTLKLIIFYEHFPKNNTDLEFIFSKTCQKIYREILFFGRSEFGNIIMH